MRPLAHLYTSYINIHMSKIITGLPNTFPKFPSIDLTTTNFLFRGDSSSKPIQIKRTKMSLVMHNVHS